MSKFAVLLSIYAREAPEYLTEALASIARQTRLPDEIVAVFDGPIGSELETACKAGLDRISSPSHILKLSKNMGLGHALQSGIESTNADYIIRVDTDDVNRPNRFAQQIALIENDSGIDALGSWIEEFTHHPGDKGIIRKVPVHPHEIKAYSRWRNPMNHMTVAFRRESVLGAGGYVEIKGFEDFFLWLRMLKMGMKFVNIPEVLVDARLNPKSIDRRRGLGYLKTERRFFSEVSKQGLLPPLNCAAAFIARGLFRLTPNAMLGSFYTAFFRVKRGGMR